MEQNILLEIFSQRKILVSGLQRICIVTGHKICRELKFLSGLGKNYYLLVFSTHGTSWCGQEKEIMMIYKWAVIDTDE